MIIKTIINITEVFLLLYLGHAAIYYLFFAIASKLPHNKRSINGKFRKFAVLIPGYKEDAVIIDVAKEALNQKYPKELYDVIIIADSFKESTIEQLKTLPVKIIEVSFDVSTKSKALNRAMTIISDQYDIALVLDADNIMEDDFLTKINIAFDNGYSIVQGHRVAKNTNTSFAVLDAISEEINNSIFRKGHRAIGLSSALIGSGMAFDYHFFKERMSSIKAVGGFDKELELTLLREGHKIEYLDDAIIYDEKVQKAEVFANQRKRWLSAQLVYFRKFFFSGIYHLIKSLNIDFFDKVYQMVSPPRIMLLGSSFFLFILFYLLNMSATFSNIIITSSHYWFGVFIITSIALLTATPAKFWNNKTLKAMGSLPRAVLIMYKAIFRLKGANKKFIHTQHGT